MISRPRREIRVAAAIAGLASLLFLPLAARRAGAEEDRGDVARTVQEVRHCGQLQLPETWQGSRWACDGLEVAKAVIRRVGEFVAGIDLTKTGRDQNPLVDNWGFSPEDAKFLRGTFFANFYFPLTLDDGAGQTGQTAGAAIAPEGSVLNASTTDTQQMQSWEDFMQNSAPITKNPLGKATLFGLASLSRYAQLTSAYQEITEPGGFFPAFQGEDPAGGSSTGSSEQSKTLDVVARAAALQSQTNNAAVGVGKVLADTASVKPGQSSSESPERPSIPAPKEGAPGTTRSSTDPLATGKGTGSADTLATGRTQGGSGLDALTCSTCLGGGGRGLGQSFGGINNFLGGSPFSQALGRFGSGGLGNLANLFNPGTFLNQLGNRFPPGGSGGGGGLLQTQELAPTGVCASQQPRLSSSNVQQVADFLGLPATSTPWLIQYRPVTSVVGTQGVEAASGRPVTIASGHFPNQECVWAVTANPPGGPQEVVVVSDTTGPVGLRLRLIIGASP